MINAILVPRRSALPSALRGWKDFDRVFDELWSGRGPSLAERAGSWTPRVDVSESDAEFRVAVEIPGVDEKEIDVSLEDGVLTIRGERAAAESHESNGLRHVETFRGKFRRSLTLPAEVDADGVKAAYRRGILTVTLPKAASAQVRNIPITS